MIEVDRTVAVPSDQVFSVLADGWSYAAWVVGTSHIRQVDPDWPRADSRIHHSVGPWPLVFQDVTKVLAIEPSTGIELEARLWPVGVAHVWIRLEPAGPDRTTVRLAEQVVRGPTKWLPMPVQELLLKPRNTETLRRLVAIASGRHGDTSSA